MNTCTADAEAEAVTGTRVCSSRHTSYGEHFCEAMPAYDCPTAFLPNLLISYAHICQLSCSVDKPTNLINLATK